MDHRPNIFFIEIPPYHNSLMKCFFHQTFLFWVIYLFTKDEVLLICLKFMSKAILKAMALDFECFFYQLVIQMHHITLLQLHGLIILECFQTYSDIYYKSIWNHQIKCLNLINYFLKYFEKTLCLRLSWEPNMLDKLFLAQEWLTFH